MRKSMRFAPVVLLFALGCQPRTVGGSGGDGSTETTDAAPVYRPRPTASKSVDVVVVETAAEDRIHLIASAAQTVSSLVQALEAKKVDYRIGFTSSTLDNESPGMCTIGDVRQRARFWLPTEKSPSDIIPGSTWNGPWPPRWRVLSPDLARYGDIAALAQLYAAHMPQYTCEIPQFLEVGFLAVDGRNTSFPRQNSLLVFLIFSNREDCSTKDDSLWNPASGWTKQSIAPARCTFPPKGLEYGVERYVKLARALHRTGPLLWYIVGSGVAAKRTTDRTGRTTVVPECNDGIITAFPAPRLVRFAADVNAAGDAGMSAVFDGKVCAFAHGSDANRMAVTRRVIDAVLKKLE